MAQSKNINPKTVYITAEQLNTITNVVDLTRLDQILAVYKRTSLDIQHKLLLSWLLWSVDAFGSGSSSSSSAKGYKGITDSGSGGGMNAKSSGDSVADRLQRVILATSSENGIADMDVSDDSYTLESRMKCSLGEPTDDLFKSFTLPCNINVILQNVELDAKNELVSALKHPNYSMASFNLDEILLDWILFTLGKNMNITRAKKNPAKKNQAAATTTTTGATASSTPDSANIPPKYSIYGDYRAFLLLNGILKTQLNQQSSYQQVQQLNNTMTLLFPILLEAFHVISFAIEGVDSRLVVEILELFAIVLHFYSDANGSSGSNGSGEKTRGVKKIQPWNISQFELVAEMLSKWMEKLTNVAKSVDSISDTNQGTNILIYQDIAGRCIDMMIIQLQTPVYTDSSFMSIGNSAANKDATKDTSMSVAGSGTGLNSKKLFGLVCEKLIPVFSDYYSIVSINGNNSQEISSYGCEYSNGQSGLNTSILIGKIGTILQLSLFGMELLPLYSSIQIAEKMDDTAQDTSKPPKKRKASGKNENAQDEQQKLKNLNIYQNLLFEKLESIHNNMAKWKFIPFVFEQYTTSMVRFLQINEKIRNKRKTQMNSFGYHQFNTTGNSNIDGGSNKKPKLLNGDNGTNLYSENGQYTNTNTNTSALADKGNYTLMNVDYTNVSTAMGSDAVRDLYVVVFNKIYKMLVSDLFCNNGDGDDKKITQNMDETKTKTKSKSKSKSESEANSENENGNVFDFKQHFYKYSGINKFVENYLINQPYFGFCGKFTGSINDKAYKAQNEIIGQWIEMFTKIFLENSNKSQNDSDINNRGFRVCEGNSVWLEEFLTAISVAVKADQLASIEIPVDSNIDDCENLVESEEMDEKSESETKEKLLITLFLENYKIQSKRTQSAMLEIIELYGQNRHLELLIEHIISALMVSNTHFNPNSTTFQSHTQSDTAVVVGSGLVDTQNIQKLISVVSSYNMPIFFVVDIIKKFDSAISSCFEPKNPSNNINTNTNADDYDSDQNRNRLYGLILYFVHFLKSSSSILLFTFATSNSNSEHSINAQYFEAIKSSYVSVINRFIQQYYTNSKKDGLMKWKLLPSLLLFHYTVIDICLSIEFTQQSLYAETREIYQFINDNGSAIAAFNKRTNNNTEKFDYKGEVQSLIMLVLVSFQNMMLCEKVNTSLVTSNEDYDVEPESGLVMSIEGSIVTNLINALLIHVDSVKSFGQDDMVSDASTIGKVNDNLEITPSWDGFLHSISRNSKNLDIVVLKIFSDWMGIFYDHLDIVSWVEGMFINYSLSTLAPSATSDTPLARGAKHSQKIDHSALQSHASYPKSSPLISHHSIFEEIYNNPEFSNILSFKYQQQRNTTNDSKNKNKNKNKNQNQEKTGYGKNSGFDTLLSRSITTIHSLYPNLFTISENGCATVLSNDSADLYIQNLQYKAKMTLFDRIGKAIKLWINCRDRNLINFNDKNSINTSIDFVIGVLNLLLSAQPSMAATENIGSAEVFDVDVNLGALLLSVVDNCLQWLVYTKNTKSQGPKRPEIPPVIIERLLTSPDYMRSVFEPLCDMVNVKHTTSLSVLIAFIRLYYIPGHILNYDGKDSDSEFYSRTARILDFLFGNGYNSIVIELLGLLLRTSSFSTVQQNLSSLKDETKKDDIQVISSWFLKIFDIVNSKIATITADSPQNAEKTKQMTVSSDDLVIYYLLSSLLNRSSVSESIVSVEKLFSYLLHTCLPDTSVVTPAVITSFVVKTLFLFNLQKKHSSLLFPPNCDNEPGNSRNGVIFDEWVNQLLMLLPMLDNSYNINEFNSVLLLLSQGCCSSNSPSGSSPPLVPTQSLLGNYDANNKQFAETFCKSFISCLKTILNKDEYQNMSTRLLLSLIGRLPLLSTHQYQHHYDQRSIKSINDHLSSTHNNRGFYGYLVLIKTIIESRDDHIFNKYFTQLLTILQHTIAILASTAPLSSTKSDAIATEPTRHLENHDEVYRIKGFSECLDIITLLINKSPNQFVTYSRNTSTSSSSSGGFNFSKLAMVYDIVNSIISYHNRIPTSQIPSLNTGSVPTNSVFSKSVNILSITYQLFPTNVVSLFPILLNILYNLLDRLLTLSTANDNGGKSFDADMTRNRTIQTHFLDYSILFTKFIQQLAFKSHQKTATRGQQKSQKADEDRTTNFNNLSSTSASVISKYLSLLIQHFCFALPSLKNPPSTTVLNNLKPCWFSILDILSTEDRDTLVANFATIINSTSNTIKGKPKNRNLYQSGRFNAPNLSTPIDILKNLNSDYVEFYKFNPSFY